MKSAFLRELFSGHIDLGSLSPFPEFGRGRAQQIAPLLADVRRDDSGRSGAELLAAHDLLGRSLSFPPSVLCRVVQELGRRDAGSAIALIAHLALGARLVERFGSETQRRFLASAPAPCFAFGLTEASPGSDVSQIQTYAEPCAGGYRISGTKNWVTNAVHATHFLVLARTVEPRAGNKPRLSAFLVARGAGVTVTPVKTSALPGAGVGELSLDGVFVEAGALLGPLGKGFRLVMSGLAEARLLLGAAATGACLRAFDDTVERLVRRRAFGRAVGAFPSVQDRLASMLSDVVALESLVYLVAGSADPTSVDAVERGIVRLAASRSSARVLDAARELFGAAAFVGDFAPARRWSDMRALTLLDGSDLALESFVLLEGTREHRRRLASLADPFDPLGRLDALGSEAARQLKSRVRRAMVRDVPGVRTFELEKQVRRFGEVVDENLRRHASEIVERQHVHRRLASIVVELGTWCALASRVETEIVRHGEVGGRRMIDAAEVWVEAARTRLEAQFSALESNDDQLRDRVAHRVLSDGAYPFDIF